MSAISSSSSLAAVSAFSKKRGRDQAEFSQVETEVCDLISAGKHLDAWYCAENTLSQHSAGWKPSQIRRLHSLCGHALVKYEDYERAQDAFANAIRCEPTAGDYLWKGNIGILTAKNTAFILRAQTDLERGLKCLPTQEQEDALKLSLAYCYAHSDNLSKRQQVVENLASSHFPLIRNQFVSLEANPLQRCQRDEELKMMMAKVRPNFECHPEIMRTLSNLGWPDLTERQKKELEMIKIAYQHNELPYDLRVRNVPIVNGICVGKGLAVKYATPRKIVIPKGTLFGIYGGWIERSLASSYSLSDYLLNLSKSRDVFLDINGENYTRRMCDFSTKSNAQFVYCKIDGVPQMGIKATKDIWSGQGVGLNYDGGKKVMYWTKAKLKEIGGRLSLDPDHPRLNSNDEFDPSTMP